MKRKDLPSCAGRTARPSLWRYGIAHLMISLLSFLLLMHLVAQRMRALGRFVELADFHRIREEYEIAGDCFLAGRPPRFTEVCITLHYITLHYARLLSGSRSGLENVCIGIR